MSKPRFSVLIVNFNSGHYLADAVASLAGQTFRDFEVIIVDNASADRSARDLNTDGLPSVTLSMESENHGFARGNNIAARKASGEWLVLLNPDAVAAPDWLERIEAAISRHPEVCTFASCQYALDAPGRLDGVGDAYLAFGFPWRGGFGHKVDQLPKEAAVFGACGASAVYKAELFETLGGFDERFFCYCEDVDLAFRIQLRGEPCVFLPDAIVHHAGSAITGRQSDFTIFHGTRNRIWVYFQNMPSVLLWLTLPLHLLLTTYLLIRSYSSGRGSITSGAMYAGYSRAIEHRRQAKQERQNRRASLMRLCGIFAWNPFDMSAHRPHIIPIKR